jgi:hypothetical protein
MAAGATFTNALVRSLKLEDFGSTRGQGLSSSSLLSRRGHLSAVVRPSLVAMSQDAAEQNIQMWKVKKLIKSLDSARGLVFYDSLVAVC